MEHFFRATTAEAPNANALNTSRKKITLRFNLYDQATIQLKGPEIGDKMSDGSIYAGHSPDTGNPIYVTSSDASLTMRFNEAKEYAAKLDAHGHQDWRVPTWAELNVLFNNQAAIGGFNVNRNSWYWSASHYDRFRAWGQRVGTISDAKGISKNSCCLVRCVR